MPKVSVILPVHNSARELPQALNGLLQQDLKDLEVIAVDDGSTDGTPEVLEQYSRKDARIRTIRQPHLGIAAALNRAIASADGLYLARHDADDVSAPTRLGRQSAYLDRSSDIGVCGTWVWIVDSESGPLYFNRIPDNPSGIQRSLESGRNPIIHGSAMIRRSTLMKLSEAYRGGYAEDYDLWLRLSRITRFGVVQSLEYFYRLSPDSLSRRGEDKGLLVMKLALKFHLEVKRFGREVTDWKTEFSRIQALPASANQTAEAGVCQHYMRGIHYLRTGETSAYREAMKRASVGKGHKAKRAQLHLRLSRAAPSLWRLYYWLLPKLRDHFYRYNRLLPPGTPLPPFASAMTEMSPAMDDGRRPALE